MSNLLPSMLCWRADVPPSAGSDKTGDAAHGHTSSTPTRLSGPLAVISMHPLPEELLESMSLGV